MVIGDSHSVDALNALVSLYPKFDYSLASIPGCTIDKNFGNAYPRTYPQYDDCLELNEEKLFNRNFLNQFDLIAINILFGGKNEENLVEYLKYLKESGAKKVIVFGGIFTYSEPLPELINRFGFKPEIIYDFVTDQSVRDAKVEIASRALGYFFVSKRDQICTSKSCDLWNANNIPMTWDQHHLSLEFASGILIRLKSALDEYLGNISSPRL